MSKSSKRTSRTEEEEEGKENKKAKTENDPKVVDPTGEESTYDIGATLGQIRLEYQDTEAWLFIAIKKKKCMSSNYKLEANCIYELRLSKPKLMIEQKEDNVLTYIEQKEKINETLHENVPSASTYASPNAPGCWNRNNKVASHVWAHRTRSGTPVVLLDPVLSELYDDIVFKKYTPSKNDCAGAKELMFFLSKGFTDEVKEMQPKIKEWAANFGWDISAISGKAGVRWLVGSALLLNIDLKKEKSTGYCSTYMQNLAYYIENWSDVASKNLRSRSNCPSILVEITGPEIAVSGAVYTPEGVLCDPFVTASLLHNVHDNHHLVTAARIIGAVGKAAKKLLHYYINPDVPFDGFPFFRSYEDKTIVYQEKIAPCLFLATLNGDTKVVVKFAHTYNQHAHKACEEVNCAPKLFFVGEVGRFVVVVMEYIADSKLWHQVHDEEQKETAYRVIQKAITNLHTKGYVHGDLRSSNILLKGERVAIIDFDWSGTPEQSYPFFMNHASLTWPDGAEDGKPLAFAHDLHWLQRRFI